MSHKLLATTLCCVSFATIAEEAPVVETSPYTASAELGMLFKTGDTKSGDIKAGFDLGYEEGQWTATGQFDLLIKKSEVTDENGDEQFETSDQKWTIVGQTNYTLDGANNNYIYGNVSYEDNRFNNFENQSSLSAGWGRRWFEDENATFDADIGPGVKRDVLRPTATQDKETNTSAIVQAQALYKRKINEHVDFSQLLVAKYAVKSDANSTYKAETSILTKLMDTLQLKFSFIVDYNTEVEAESENVNTETSMTLVYSF